MPPSNKELEEALIAATISIYQAEPEGTSVNKVRKQTEEDIGLEDGFFSEGPWKQRSKALIKEYVEKLLDEWTPEYDMKKKSKRQSPENNSPEPKRRKSATKPKVTQRDDEVPESTDENEDSLALSPNQKRKRAEPTDLEEDENEKASDEETSAAAQDEEEEFSDVIDDGPLPKRKKKSTTTSNVSNPKKDSKPSSNNTTDNPQEAEIKKLQSQLSKCGIRKLWHNELKPYTTPSAKMKHLRQMLADAGIHGRFSEARAKEIRESRELAAEVEAAREMDSLWGRDGGRRGRGMRGGDKNKIKGNDDDGGGDTGGSEDDGKRPVVAARRRARADLAFLGDDSDSE